MAKGAGPRYGFLDHTGAPVIEARFHDARPFSHGLARVETRAGRSGHVALIDGHGEEVISALDDALPAQDGHVAICRQGRWHVVDHQGNDIAGPFGGAQNLGNARLGLRRGGWQLYAPNTHGGEPLQSRVFHYFSDKGYRDGRCAVAADGVFHLDPDGLPITAPGISDLIYDYAAGRCQVMRYTDGLHGFVDLDGECVIPRKYERASDFHPRSGLAPVSVSNAPGSGGYIDRDGQEFWQD